MHYNNITIFVLNIIHFYSSINNYSNLSCNFMIMLFFVVPSIIFFYCNFDIICFIYRRFKIAHEPAAYH